MSWPPCVLSFNHQVEWNALSISEDFFFEIDKRVPGLSIMIDFDRKYFQDSKFWAGNVNFAQKTKTISVDSALKSWLPNQITQTRIVHRLWKHISTHHGYLNIDLYRTSVCIRSRTVALANPYSSQWLPSFLSAKVESLQVIRCVVLRVYQSLVRRKRR